MNGLRRSGILGVLLVLVMLWSFSQTVYADSEERIQEPMRQFIEVVVRLRTGVDHFWAELHSAWERMWMSIWRGFSPVVWSSNDRLYRWRWEWRPERWT